MTNGTGVVVVGVGPDGFSHRLGVGGGFANLSELRMDPKKEVVVCLESRGKISVEVARENHHSLKSPVCVKCKKLGGKSCIA